MLNADLKGGNEASLKAARGVLAPVERPLIEVAEEALAAIQARGE